LKINFSTGDMMAETKRRQGQRGATPKPLCPKCDEYLNRCYTRKTEGGKRLLIGAGWICPSSTCDYMIKDYIELEDTEDGEDET
jgi:hypothetical protein